MLTIRIHWTGCGVAVVVALSVLGASPLGAQNALPPTSPLQVRTVETIPYEITGLAMPVGGAICDSTLVVADLQSAKVVKLLPSGEVAWSKGGKGDGPGEFNFLYKVATDRACRVHAYDIGGSEISVFSRDGEFIDRIPLGVSFRQVDGLLVLPSGEYVVAGVAIYPGDIAKHPLHFFSDSGMYERSVGSLPRADSVSILNYWGVGGIDLDSQGNILYGRRLPYDFFRYSVSGRQLGSMSPGISMEGKPDDAYVIERDEQRFKISYSDTPVERPRPPHVIWGDRILSGRIGGEVRTWDVLSFTGDLEYSVKIPEHWGGILAVDTESSAIWLVGNPRLTNDIVRIVVDVPTDWVADTSEKE